MAIDHKLVGGWSTDQLAAAALDLLAQWIKIPD
jgi:hypothetical protein